VDILCALVISKQESFNFGWTHVFAHIAKEDDKLLLGSHRDVKFMTNYKIFIDRLEEQPFFRDRHHNDTILWL
jgi:hypothetical protein